MELLFVVLLGVLIGLLGRAVLPGRGQVGLLLLPAIGGSAGAVIWVAGTWLGLSPTVLLWVAALLASALSVAAACLLSARARDRQDARTFEAVSSGRA